MNFGKNATTFGDEKKNENVQMKNNEKQKEKLNLIGSAPKVTYRSISVRTMNHGEPSEMTCLENRMKTLFQPSDHRIDTTTSKNNSAFLPSMPEMKRFASREVDMIDVRRQDQNECDLSSQKVFVPCATLQPLNEDVKLIISDVTMEDGRQNIKTGQSFGLKISATYCIVSNGIRECMQLVPLSLARVSDDIELKMFSSVVGSNCRTQVPFIEGCIIMTHKPIRFAVHFYQYPNDNRSTVLEFQRRNGDIFLFQTFYQECLKQLEKTMSNLRHNNPILDGWNSLPTLDSMIVESEGCNWDKDSLDVLAGLIEEESQEAVDMLGLMCEQMEKYVSLRTQVLQHKQLMEQLMTRVLTHQDECFVRLGLVALDLIIREQKAPFVTQFLRSLPMLAIVIRLLNCTSVFVLRRAVRLLSLLADQCLYPWKLNELQKKILMERVPCVQNHLLKSNAWSGTYATDSFVTRDMFRCITQHVQA